MDKLLFGISGLPLGKEGDKFTYATGIEYLYDIGLDAMELPFVRSVNVTNKNRPAILEAKEKYNFYLSAHGSYFINLNAVEEEKKEKSGIWTEFRKAKFGRTFQLSGEFVWSFSSSLRYIRGKCYCFYGWKEKCKGGKL